MVAVVVAAAGGGAGGVPGRGSSEQIERSFPEMLAERLFDNYIVVIPRSDPGAEHCDTPSIW